MMFFIAEALILFDIISTEWVLKHGGRELNPIMRNKYVRWTLTILIKIIFMFWVFYLQLTIPLSAEPINVFFMIVTFFYGIITIFNLRSLIELKKAIKI